MPKPKVQNLESDVVQLQFVLPQLIDIETLANTLSVSERNVRRMVQERRIEIVKVGRGVRFDVDVVRQWVDSHRRPPDPK